VATFRTHAKVPEPDDAPARLDEAGIGTCPGGPGQVLADVLARTGGVYETRMPLTPDLRERIREVAELTADAELLAVSELSLAPGIQARPLIWISEAQSFAKPHT
jgi:hypothetical protein